MRQDENEIRAELDVKETTSEHREPNGLIEVVTPNNKYSIRMRLLSCRVCAKLHRCG